jgi:hypothetical protein
MALKHIGRVKANQRKVVVAYRTIPGDPYSCIVIPTESLSNDEHDALIRCVESSAGQSAYEFCEAMARYTLPDGRNMLAGFHTGGRMVKMATNAIEMQPDTKTTISLDELNNIIAEQKGVGIEDLALSDGVTPKNPNTIVEDVATVQDLALTEQLQAPETDVVTDEQLAAKYRSDADRMYKEAKRLREMAEELVPTKKKGTKKESV